MADKDMGNASGTKGGMYHPTGKLQGDTKEMPYQGTKTGVTDTYGADVGQDATNSLGGFSAGSDCMEAC